MGHIWYYAKTKNQEIIEDFTHSNADRMFVDHHEWANAHSCRNSLNQTVRNLHLCAKAVVKKGEVYLVRPY